MKNGNGKPKQTVETANIPLALQNAKRWIFWNWRTTKDGKKIKQPCYISKVGSVLSKGFSDSDVWRTFESITRPWGHEFDGLGFHFKDCHEAEQLVAIDLDQCRDVETGELTESAATICRRLNSYTEVSPSGTGLRIFVFAVMPGSARSKDTKDKHVEFFFRSGFVTVTGDRLEDYPEEVCARQAEIDWLYQSIFPDKCIREASGTKSLKTREEQIDWARELLSALDPGRPDDYWTWLEVGMALHSVDDELLEDWDRWSQQSGKYADLDEIRAKWASFRGSGISLGSLYYIARQDGYEPTLKPNQVGFGTAIPVEETFGAITDALKSTGVVFHDQDGDVVHVSVDGDYRLIDKPNLLHGAFARHGIQTVQQNKECIAHKILPADYANAYLSPLHPRGLDGIQLFSRNPIYDENFELLQPGYDAASGIFYAGPVYQPQYSTEAIDSLLADFCFQDEVDRVNLIGMMLTAILANKFWEQKPMLVFAGNQAGIGKTICAQHLGILLEDCIVPTISYTENQEELEKRIASRIKAGHRTLIFDNVKDSIDSPVLERCVTDRELSFRLLGGNNLIKATNSHSFCVTANGPECARDLATRIIPVNLAYDGDPRKRKFACTQPLEKAKELRPITISELLGMVEEWKLAGMPRGRVDCRSEEWGAIVGGILEANGCRG